MPAKDLFHEAVKNALIKDGWTITDDPLSIKVGGMDFYIDLGAEKLIGAEKEGRKIAIEIKGFTSLSQTYEFHLAVGQFVNYRVALEEKEPDRVLYLAVPSDTYKDFFKLDFVKTVIEKQHLKLIICNVKKEEVTKWQE